MIEWNDGLNLGVTSLDDDHKKLLHIINNISDAINNNESNDVIESIFKELYQSPLIIENLNEHTAL